MENHDLSPSFQICAILKPRVHLVKEKLGFPEGDPYSDKAYT